MVWPWLPRDSAQKFGQFLHCCSRGWSKLGASDGVHSFPARSPGQWHLHEVERDFRHAGLDPWLEVVARVPNVMRPLSLSLQKIKRIWKVLPEFVGILNVVARMQCDDRADVYD